MVRAGQISDEAATLGGVSAESRARDYKLVNSVVAFIVQDAGGGDFSVSSGGGVIDADLVRDAGEPGRDLIDDEVPMIGLGRTMEADDVAVIDDGLGGHDASVRMTGVCAPMPRLAAAREDPELAPDRDCSVVRTYVLEPDSHLLRVTTELTWDDEETELQVGHLLILSGDVAAPWAPGAGFDAAGIASGAWVGATGHRDELAVALFPDGQVFTPLDGDGALDELGTVLTGFGDTVTVASGDVVRWTTWLGVGPDLATLSGEWLQMTGVATEALGGTVFAGGSPLPGARVHMLDADGLPQTLARTDAEGRWSAEVQAGNTWSAVATGRGTGVVVDLPSGAGWTSPYASDDARERTRASLDGSAPEHNFASANGISAAVVATADTTMLLDAAGTLRVEIADGGPAVVRVDSRAVDRTRASAALVPARPDGLLALAYVRDGDVDLPLEPGTYSVVVHRGARSEPWQGTVKVVAGETTTERATVGQAWSLGGLLALDPRSSAAPSADAAITMEDRLIVAAANGLDVHFAADRDQIVDYRPLLEPLGLYLRLGSIVGYESSPTLAGRFSAYPLRAHSQSDNNGAFPWWEGDPSTESLFSSLRGQLYFANKYGGTLGVIQAHEPWSGDDLWTRSGYDAGTGTYADPTRWSLGFDAVETLVGGRHEASLAAYLDLISRGQTLVPVGVSASRGRDDGAGESLTWLLADVDSGPLLTDSIMVGALLGGRGIPSTGPMIFASVDDKWAPGATLTGRPTVRVEIYTTSWMALDTLSLIRDTETVGTWSLVKSHRAAAGDTGADGAASTKGPRYTIDLPLDGDVDAVYTVVVSGSTAMAPVYPDALPWAMTGPIRVDVDSDGWEAPLAAPAPAR